MLEDLHWADDGMLAFIEHLAADAPEAPLFLLATTRPELLQRRPKTLSSSMSTAQVTLSPLTLVDTESLVSALLDDVLAEDIGAPILERAGGNPLYAEEYARLLLERGLLLRTSGGLHLRAGEDLPLPDTVQAVLAARLDTLPPEHKAILSDAAVFGETFWGGGVAVLAQRSEAEVEAIVSDLAQRQLVRSALTSSFAGEPEHVFWHGLVRDVVYGEMPRAARAGKHAGAAAWLENKAGDHVDELAEIIAFHYVTGLDLARAAGEPVLAESLLEPAIDFLTLAGNRALPLDVHAAELHYSRALELAGQSRAERPELLCGWARVLYHTNRHRESVAAWDQAIEHYRAFGEHGKAAVAMCEQVGALETLNEPTWQNVQAALDLLADRGPSPELAFVLTLKAGHGLVTGGRTPQETIEAVNRIMGLTAELGLPESARALRMRGVARMQLGDHDGIEDLTRGMAAAKAQGLLFERAVTQWDYVANLMDLVGADDALEACVHALDEARRTGAQLWTLAFRAGLIQRQYFTGDWDEALGEADGLQTTLLQAGDSLDLMVMQGPRAVMLAAKGHAEEAIETVEWLLGQGRAAEMPWLAAYALVAAAAVRNELGQPEAVRELLGELATHDIIDYTEFVRPSRAWPCRWESRTRTPNHSGQHAVVAPARARAGHVPGPSRRGPDRTRDGGGRLRRRRRPLARLRRALRGSPSLTGPGALPGGARPSAGGGSAPGRGPRDLRAARGRAGARRDGRVAREGGR